MIINKKFEKGFFEDIVSGRKNFEVRINEFDANVGDTLILEEYDENRKPTGRRIEKKIKYVLRTEDCSFYKEKDIIEKGFIVLALE